jgi:hypothetical protein
MAAKRTSRRDLHGAAPDRSDTAVVILDMISDFEFEDGARVFRAALPVARRIGQLAERARRFPSSMSTTISADGGLIFRRSCAIAPEKDQEGRQS